MKRLLIMVLFFLVTWEVESPPTLFMFEKSDPATEAYNISCVSVDKYKRFTIKTDPSCRLPSIEYSIKFSTEKEAREFIKNAPIGRSSFGHKAYGFKIQRIEEIK